MDPGINEMNDLITDIIIIQTFNQEFNFQIIQRGYHKIYDNKLNIEILETVRQKCQDS